MNTYIYEGPVMSFETCVTSLWVGETQAVSESKAKANLTYRWKKEHDLVPSAKITLPGKIVMVQGKDISDGRVQIELP